MPVFAIQKNAVKKVPPVKPGIEKSIQTLFENNLDEILNIHFLASEYSTSFGGRIDTLGIDKNGSPAIIEYKRNHSDSIINQGLSYLRWLLDHKADFEILVHRAKAQLAGVEIDWNAPRVICVAESYNKFDLDTADLLPINIELLRYSIYSNSTLLVESETQQKVRISTQKLFGKKEKNELKNKDRYTISEHLKHASPTVKKIYLKLQGMILALDENILEEPKSKYIAYKLTTNFVDIVVLKDSIKLFLNMPSGELSDLGGLARDLNKPKKIGHWGNGDYEVKIHPNDATIEQIFDLIKQSYNYNK